MSTYLAHVAEDGREQTLEEHCRGTAQYAADCCTSVGLRFAGYLAGLMHDFGKYTKTFQRYLTGEEKHRRGDVIHTFQGCKYIYDTYQKDSDPYMSISAEIVSYCMGAHHGLFDCVDGMHRIGLQYRAEKQGMDYEESTINFFRSCATEEEINALFAKTTEELSVIIGRIDQNTPSDTEFSFQIGLLIRLLLSAVIEGDRRDTAIFMDGISVKNWPEDMSAIWAKSLTCMEEKLTHFSCTSPIDKARKEISDRCARFAKKTSGVYRLNVPTGSGKTLSSLRYALTHAAKHNKKHIIFTTPLLSILEQNAAEIHKYVGNDAMILEHHSNVVCEEQTAETLDRRGLLVQAWDAPIIITTMVQLLNTFFSGKTSSIRRFHSLCESVIVIDEVQTIPANMLSLFNLTIRFLSDYCGATVLLCSATQPCLEKTEHPLKETIPDVIPYDPELWKPFHRTEIRPLEDRRLEELPTLIREMMEQTRSLLVICNTKKEVAALAKATRSDEWTSFHLSAGMCMQHRRDTVNALKQSLRADQKTLCIATQVIEAGVDISFQNVMRLTAGMDSVIQSAGRCNRNGESELCQSVYLINCADESLGRLTDIQRGKTATIALIEAYRQSPERFDGDLSSAAAIAYYYKYLYAGMAKGVQDYYVPKLKTTLYDLLSINEKYTSKCLGAEEHGLRQAFRTAGDFFEVFDESTIDVIVPYGTGKRIIEELGSAQTLSNMVKRKQLLKAANAYTVSLYNNQYEGLRAKGALLPVCEGYALALQEGYYDDVLGIKEDGEQIFLEV